MAADFEDSDPRPSRKRQKKAGKKAGKAKGGADGAGQSGRGSRARGGLGVRLLRAALGLGVLAAILGAAGVAGLFLYYGNDPAMPSLGKLTDYRPKQLVRVLDRSGEVIGEIGEKRTVVPYKEIPKVLVDAVVAAEDADYFHHAGLDYRGMLRAFIENVVRGRTAQGGSTITQQLVKGLLLTPERTLRRKVQEIILARALSQRFSKEDVLALYLNQIYYGHGRYGCEEASRFFFGKPVREVTLGEAALLAGLPQSPERLSPRKHPEAAKTRQRYVLGQMAENGFIDRATAEKVAAEPIALARDPFPSLGLAPEATDAATRVLRDTVGEAKAEDTGAVVRTTIDARLQALAREALEHGLEEVDARQGYRGPSGHLGGKALDKRRAELTAAHKGGVKESEIVEGIVLRVERDDKDAKVGRLWVDLGGSSGAVDLALEPRYAPVGSGGKALPDRFTAGDLVRVRVAPERPPVDGKPALALELGPQGAMVVMDPVTRDVLALVGGWGYHTGGFDRATRAHRQPGSAWKPFVYAPALESGKYTAATMVNDAPEVYEMPGVRGDWKPQNYEKEEYRGPIRLRTALAHSVNTVAIRVLADIGVPAGREAAARLGITSPIPEDIGLSLALGAATVTPLELAGAFSTFADGGRRADPVLVTQAGDTVIARKPAVAALKPEAAYVLVSMMKSVIEEGTAKPALAGKLKRPAAGKTGTSNDHRDAWFVGFTPDLLAVVWVGFDDMKKLGKGEVGGRTAAPPWLDFMQKALAGKPPRDFAQPPGIVVARIDRATGLLAPPGTDGGLDEVFIEGTAPTETAPAVGEEPSADRLLLEQ